MKTIEELQKQLDLEQEQKSNLIREYYNSLCELYPERYFISLFENEIKTRMRVWFHLRKSNPNFKLHETERTEMYIFYNNLLKKLLNRYEHNEMLEIKMLDELEQYLLENPMWFDDEEMTLWVQK